MASGTCRLLLLAMHCRQAETATTDASTLHMGNQSMMLQRGEAVRGVDFKSRRGPAVPVLENLAVQLPASPASPTNSR